MFSDCLIETDRLILRPFTMNDVSEFHEIVTQEEVVRYLAEGLISLEELRKILEWLIDCYDGNSPQSIIKFTLAVTHKKTNKIIGWCGLGPLQFSPSEIEIYYGVSVDHRGRGLATEAAKALLDYGFSTIGLDTIVAVVKPDNVASRKVIEKLGMKQTKVVENLPPGSEFYEGMLYYSLDRTEYLATVPGRAGDKQ